MPQAQWTPDLDDVTLGRAVRRPEVEHEIVALHLDIHFVRLHRHRRHPAREEFEAGLVQEDVVGR